ncbi:MAG: tRNA pseudouridine(38-40) synthase TruA [Proteobacteria bacterium]|nr:tRNA pseudouridine(38-40) synthase TruA [Pseudomonadota bacterium]
MPRYKLTIEYDGTPFVGWQRQNNGPSVQAALEQALHRFCGETVMTYAAGRTDSGVHALGQVVHFDLTKDWPAETVRNALNYHLRPQPIAVLASEAVPAIFHARSSAKARRYVYRILNRHAPPTVTRNRVWHVHVPLDAGAMHEAAQALLGMHDFSTFRGSYCQAKSPVRTLDRLDAVRSGEEIRVEAQARSFLQHQVRNMVGSLRLVGEGKWTTADLAAALAARDRTKGGPTAPPDGLYLVEVLY